MADDTQRAEALEKLAEAASAWKSARYTYLEAESEGVGYTEAENLLAAEVALKDAAVLVEILTERSAGLEHP